MPGAEFYSWNRHSLHAKCWYKGTRILKRVLQPLCFIKFAGYITYFSTENENSLCNTFLLACILQGKSCVQEARWIKEGFEKKSRIKGMYVSKDNINYRLRVIIPKLEGRRRKKGKKSFVVNPTTVVGGDGVEVQWKREKREKGKTAHEI